MPEPHATATPPTSFRRILVALDSSTASDTTLETAAGIAAATASELIGLFVEDLDLLRLAEMPFAREVQLAKAMSRALEPAQLLLDLRAQAAVARAAMAKQATLHRVSWSFQVTQGRSEDAILLAAGAGDIIALARGFGPLARFGRFSHQVRLIAARAPVPVLLAGKTSPERQGTTILPYDASEIVGRSLRLAAELALARGEPLEIMLLGAAALAMEDLGERLRRETGRQEVPELRIWTPRDRSAALRRLCEADRGLLVLPASSPNFEAAQIERILDQARVPIILQAQEDEPSPESVT